MKTALTLFVLVLAQAIAAQNIDLDKSTGLVKLDGKDAFYLIKTNKIAWNFDLSLQNLDKQQLAYFAVKDVADLPYDEKGSHTGTFFLVTFSETANTANVFPESFNVMKQVAKQVVNGKLLKDGKIDPKAERAFVVSHQGRLVKEPETINVTINAPTGAAKAADIVIKNNSIYNNDELVGSFKQTEKDGITTVSVYDKSDSKIASAIRPSADASADWEITTLPSNKHFQLLYNEAKPLDKLFRFLAEKGVF